MSVVFIVPTGIGASIGGHAGDATPALRLIAEVAGEVITHPNVVNASAINEMPDNVLYVDGSLLDKFLEGVFWLMKVRSNRVLVALNPPASTYAKNIVRAARATCGVDARWIELDEPLAMTGWVDEGGRALGQATGVKSLIRQVRKERYDALAVITPIHVPADAALRYFREGGTNPWGAIEARVSRMISKGTGYKPTAHAPLESEATKANEELYCVADRELVDPRQAAEAVSANYAHCVLKGLHRAPRAIAPRLWWRDAVSLADVECLISPDGCIGTPHLECFQAGIPVVAVEENATVLNERDDRAIYVRNYLEAAGVVAMLRAGVTRESVSRRGPA